MKLFSADDADLLGASAWLHDIGYAPALVVTGFHPLDGAQWLRAHGYNERVTNLVAHHSCARIEAALRGLDDRLVEFPREESAVADALWYADMTTGPDGRDLDVAARLEEIRARYGEDDIVTRFILKATPDIVAALGRTEARLRGNS
jgi:HD superfamily phosphodiesterase